MQPWGGYGAPPGPYAPRVAYAGQHGAAPEQPTSKDVDQLKTLGICTICYGVLFALLSLFALIYIAIGIGIAVDPGPTAPGDPDPAIVGGVFAIVGLVVMGILLVKGTLLVASGIGLTRHKWRTLSYVTAGLACMNIPLGTILGVCTIMVLSRPSVRVLYEGR